MLKSIQWKLVIIYVLLVWLAMSIIGLYIVQAVEKDQISNLVNSVVPKGNYLSFLLKDKMIGVYNVQDIIDYWFLGQGDQIHSVYIFNKNGRYLAHKGGEMRDPIEDGFIIDRALRGEVVKDYNSTIDLKKNYKSIALPILSGNDELLGAIYLNVDLTQINESIVNIKNILTSATILAICITILLGSVLARTITGPIKEVTSQAEKLAKGDFGHIITVKSNDEVGQLTEMFNYMTLRLKSTLNEMYNEKSKIETILTYMTDGVVAVDMKGMILHANPAAFKVFKIKEQDIEGKHFNDIMAILGLDFKLNGLIFDEEEKDNIINISDSIIRVSIVPFKNERYEIAGAIIVLQDVTEQENLDRMRKEFVANVSHELRTPLTTIKSYAETLHTGALDDRDAAMKFIHVIESESDRMTRLVKDLLMLSRLDYDREELNMKKIDITKIVNDCIYKMEISAKFKKQNISLHVEDTIPSIVGDKDRIEQVIINIISNSIEYTPEKGKIDVKLAKDGEYISIKVIDNGIGIPKEDAIRLFERFYRVDKARSRMLGGTGLGLSIAKQIVEAHKGSINLESSYGEGTEVTIKLPLFQDVNLS
ncbi:MAG: cell wall metabolism sensor histidine kinase WalK [Firmicutes bacterium]|nr:cell wall metabolism sensor histidine kinase WalK [Bacillota bacterium]